MTKYPNQYTLYFLYIITLQSHIDPRFSKNDHFWRVEVSWFLGFILPQTAQKCTSYTIFGYSFPIVSKIGIFHYINTELWNEGNEAKMIISTVSQSGVVWQIRYHLSHSWFSARVSSSIQIVSPEKVKYPSVMCITMPPFWLCFYFDLHIFQTSWSVNLAHPSLGVSFAGPKGRKIMQIKIIYGCWNWGYRPPIRTYDIVKLLCIGFRFWKYHRLKGLE